MHTLIERLNAANLTAKVYRTARILLDRANASGVTILAWPEFLEITRCGDMGAARRHLREITKAGLARCQGGKGFVVVWWCHAPSLTENAQNLTVNITEGPIPGGLAPLPTPQEIDLYISGGDRAQNLRVNAQKRRVSAEDRRENEAPIGWLVDQPNTYTNGEINQPTNQEGAHVDHALAVSLLLACKVAYPKANELATKTPFQEIRRQVAAWLPESDKARNPAGLLIHRIEARNPAPDLTPEFKRSRYYLDYLTGEEKRAQEAAEAAALARVAEYEARRALVAAAPMVEAVAGAGDPLQALWGRAKAEFMTSLPLGSDVGQWLEGSVITHEGEAPSEAGGPVPYYRLWIKDGRGVPWLNNRAAAALRRSLGGHLGQRVMLEVVAVEAPG